MANRFWSVSAGGDKTAVAETAVMTSVAHVEVRITYDNPDLARNKLLAMELLEAIRQRIVEDSWPPDAATR